MSGAWGICLDLLYVTLDPGIAQALPAHIPGLPLAGQPVRRMRRTHARPSVPRAKTKVFAQEARHLRRRGTSMCLEDRRPPKTAYQDIRATGFYYIITTTL